MFRNFTQWSLCVIISVAAILIAGAAMAQYNRPGSTDAQFLLISVSPRGSAMGDSFFSLVEGGEAGFYNEAALARSEGSSAVLDHVMWLADISEDFFGFSHTFGTLGSFGVYVASLHTSPMEETTPLMPDGTGQTFRAYNSKFNLSYARYLTDRVTIGASVGYIYMSLFPGFSARAVTGDVSVMYVDEAFHQLHFALRIENFGSDVKYVNEAYPLPTAFEFGLGFNVIDNKSYRMLLAVSAVKPNEQPSQLRTGVELVLLDKLYIRAGYKPMDQEQNLSLGLGVLTKVFGNEIAFNYSFTKFVLLGDVQRFGVQFFIH